MFLFTIFGLLLINFVLILILKSVNAVVVALISTAFILLILFIQSSIQKRDAKILTTVLQKYASGNFLAENDRPFVFTQSKEMNNELKALQKTMKDWLFNMLQSEINLGQYASKLLVNSKDTKMHMDLISEQINQIKINSKKIASASMDNASVSEEMQSSNDQLSNYSQDYMEVTEGTLVTIKSGKKTIVTALEGIDIIEHKMNESVKKVNELDQLMHAIADMTNGISSISDQTNLLALNASIEAARAGDAGRGFAVVASEVTKLADESNTLAEAIKSEIVTIERSIKSVVTEINDAVKSTQSIKQSNQSAIDNLDQIVMSAEGMLEFIKNIALSISEQLTASETLAGNVEQLAEIAANSESVTAKADEDIKEHGQKNQENTSLSLQIQVVSEHLNAFVHKFDEAINEELYKTGEELCESLAKGKVDNQFLGAFSKKTGISEFYITNEKGVTVLSNNPAGIGFTIENDPSTQAYVFYEILNNPRKRVSQAMTIRDIDGKYFKFVGMSRTDQKGIVQMGLALDDILNFRGQYASK